MTVNVQTPYIVYIGDGVITDFAFTYGLVETFDLIIIVDGIVQIEYSDYTLEPAEGFPSGNRFWLGGTVKFTNAPASESTVVILRKTTITQQTDYEDFTRFPAETHEEVLDKITYILQELRRGIWGGIDGDGNPILYSFDLGVIPHEFTMEITNSGGTGVTLPMWVSDTYAGVFAGEITTSAPADEAATTKPDGYIFIEVLE
jgi:hypothetical protein